MKQGAFKDVSANHQTQEELFSMKYYIHKLAAKFTFKGKDSTYFSRNLV
ncbi:hypothetical protein [Bacillus pakistanensis]|nr:hypothetical protein [Bacillus pakistanensis]